MRKEYFQMFSIADELKKLPSKSGVYLMKDKNGAIIYVGKAVNLRNRVRSYFRESSAAQNPKLRSMVPRISQFEYIVTDNEVEALILECNLIKQHKPKYNISLKDDKSHYPYIKLTDYECLPRIFYSKKREKKGRFFGPYTSGERVKEVIKLIHDIWPLRRCGRSFPRDYGKGRPCLQFHVNQCKAPCHHHISETDYNQMVKEVVHFAQGKIEPVVAKLTQEMQHLSENMEFEKAAEKRDLLQALALLTEKQKAETANFEDRDIIALARRQLGQGYSDEALMQVFFVRGGKMIGREHFTLQGVTDLPDDEVFAAFIKQFYGEVAFIPKELALAHPTADKEAIEKWLTHLKGQRVRITVPQKGEKQKLVKLASLNASLTFEQFGAHLKREAERNHSALQEIAEALKLSSTLARIEAYDISNIQGFESVGSMVVFENGKAKNSDYRKFKLKWVVGPDDYAGMEEVVTRRFKRYKNEADNKTETEVDNSWSKKPDILMIDGGKGQVHTVERALKEIGLEIPVCGMIKDDRHRTKALMFQDIEIPLPRHGEGFKLVTRIQDEVHRFALEYHRKLRADAQVRSVLDDIPGIGSARRKALMRHFKGIDPIRAATVEELSQVDSMNLKAAEAVYAFFRT